jgi:hypothetical protein
MALLSVLCPVRTAQYTTFYTVLSKELCAVFCTVRNWYTVIYSAEPRSFCMSLLASYSVSFICNRTIEAYVPYMRTYLPCGNLTLLKFDLYPLSPPLLGPRGVDGKWRVCHHYHNSKSQSSYCHRTDPITNEQVKDHE